MDINRARQISDDLLQRDPIHGLEVTELPADEGEIQWRLAVFLYMAGSIEPSGFMAAWPSSQLPPAVFFS